jgi:hypothetical protein
MLRLAYADLLRPAFRQVGEALGTLFSLLNVALSPIRWMSECIRDTVDASVVRHRRRLKAKKINAEREKINVFATLVKV